MNGSAQAKLYRRLALLVKVSAVAIVAVSGAFEILSGKSGVLSAWRDAEGFLAINLDNGRRVQISLSKASTEPPTAAVKADASAEPMRVPSPAISKSGAGGRADMAQVSDTAPRSARCLLDDGTDGLRGLSRTSVPADSGMIVDGYGLADASLLGSDRRSTSVLPLLASIKAQGAASSLQIAVERTASMSGGRLPSTLDAMPVGAGFFVMGVAHDAIDLLEVGHGPFAAELTPWYHTLNAGMRTQIVGGMACEPTSLPLGNSAGRSTGPIADSLYVSDGRSRLFDFTVNGRRPDRRLGREARLTGAALVTVRADLEAELPASAMPLDARSTEWNIERARYGPTRAVNVELVVNGTVAATRSLPADGKRRSMEFTVPIEHSSWVALRLMGAGHSNPVYVLVDNQPIRASRMSVEWSQRALLQAFEAEHLRWSAADAPMAAAAFRYAYALYDGILHQTASP